MNGLIGLAVLVAGFVVIENLAKDRNRWQSAALTEGQAHRNTRSILADVQQQLQSTLGEINVLRSKLDDPKDPKKA